MGPRMSHWNPKAIWDELLRTLRGADEDRDDQAADPNLLFHLLFTAPLLLSLLAMAKRP